jgi:hypothetical protein
MRSLFVQRWNLETAQTLFVCCLEQSRRHDWCGVQVGESPRDLGVGRFEKTGDIRNFRTFLIMYS